MFTTEKLLALTLAFSFGMNICSAQPTTLPAGNSSEVKSKTFEDAIAAADDNTKKGQFAAVLASAQMAIDLAPDRFEGYYYASFSLFRQELLDRAEAYAQDARKRAPEGQRGDVERLLSAIASQRVLPGRLKEADEAFASGLIGRAAELYTQIWKSVPSRTDIGLKAANLWADRLQDYEQALLTLYGLVDDPRNPDVAREASAKLEALQPQKDAIYKAKLKTASGLLYRDAIGPLTELVAISPASAEPHVELAGAYAMLGDRDAAKAEVSKAARIGLPSIKRLLEFNSFLDKEYEQLFIDVFGRNVATENLTTRRQEVQEEAKTFAAIVGRIPSLLEVNYKYLDHKTNETFTYHAVFDKLFVTDGCTMFLERSLFVSRGLTVLPAEKLSGRIEVSPQTKFSFEHRYDKDYSSNFDIVSLTMEPVRTWVNGREGSRSATFEITDLKSVKDALDKALRTFRSGCQKYN